MGYVNTGSGAPISGYCYLIDEEKNVVLVSIEGSNLAIGKSNVTSPGSLENCAPVMPNESAVELYAGTDLCNIVLDGLSAVISKEGYDDLTITLNEQGSAIISWSYDPELVVV